MTETTRNRLIGALLFLTGIAGAWVVYQHLAGPTGLLVVFLAGAFLGLGSALMATARPLWHPDSWWAARHPLKRDWF